MDRVRDWMTAQVITVGPEHSVAAAREIMWNRHIRHLPVVDRGRLIGIVSDRDVRGPDVAAAVALSSTQREVLAGSHRPVRSLMATGVQTAWPHDTVVYAASLMAQWKIGALPVVDHEEDDRLVGIITTTDCLRALVRLHRSETDDPRTAASDR
jgi:acetoin utilization protein AcuB